MKGERTSYGHKGTSRSTSVPCQVLQGIIRVRGAGYGADRWVAGRERKSLLCSKPFIFVLTGWSFHHKISTGDHNLYYKDCLILTQSDLAPVGERKDFPPHNSVKANGQTEHVHNTCSDPLGLEAAKALSVMVGPKSESDVIPY